jgi:hypothetical protein
MSFGGPIDSMQTSLKQNKKWLRGRRRLKQIQRDYPLKSSELDSNREGARRNYHTDSQSSVKDFSLALKLVKLAVLLISIGLVFYFFATMDWTHIKEVIR